MAVLTAEVLSEQAVLLARGGPDAERAAVFLLRASEVGREERAAALRAGVLSAVLPYLRPCTPTQLLVPLAQSFSNYCRYVEPEQPVDFELVSPALPYVTDLLDCEDENVLEAACAIVANITHGDSERTDAARAVPELAVRLEALLAHDATSVKQVALTALGNLLAGGHVQAKGCAKRVAVFLRDGPPALARGAARAAGNMLADPATIQLALNAGVLPLLCKLLEYGSEGKEEAARALANLCRFGSDVQRALVFNMNVLEPCYDALEAAAGAPPTLQLLAGLNELMEQATGKKDFECSDSSTNSAKLLSSRLHKLGILDLVEQLLKYDDEEVQSQALQLKADVAFYMRGENIVYGDGKVFTVADIAEELQSSEPGRRLRAASAALRMMRRARCDQNLTHQVVTIQGASGLHRVHEVMKLMLSHEVDERLAADLDKDDCPDLQYEVAKAYLSVYRSYDRNYSTSRNSVFHKFVVLAGKKGKVAAVAIHVLGKMPVAVYSTNIEKNIEWDTKILRVLLPYLQRDTPSDLLTSCLKICFNLSFNPDMADELASALPFILDLLTIEVQVHYWLILCHMINNSDKGREAVLAMAARVVAAMVHKAAKVRRGALKTVMCLLKGSLTQRVRCFDEGCLEHIARALETKSSVDSVFGSLSLNSDQKEEEKELATEAAEAAELVLSGPRAHVRRAVDAGILKALIKMLTAEKGCDVVKSWFSGFGTEGLTGKLNAARATRNLCQNGSAAHRDLFVEQGGLEAWARLLRGHPSTIDIVLSGLDALNQAVSEGGLNTEALRSRVKALDYSKRLKDLRNREDIVWWKKSDNERDLFKRYSALL